MSLIVGEVQTGVYEVICSQGSYSWQTSENACHEIYS